jgi:serine/threonine-protein phosphatase CPPED1
MTRPLALLATAGILAAVTLLSAAGVRSPLQPAAGDKFAAAVEAKNPWTGLTPNAAPDAFQFAVVSDRTGGHRKGVFSRAVKQVNLLQPEFVLSVGDLIEGSTAADANRTQWDEFDRYARQFEMPFFYCAGNHDGNNRAKAEVWQERLGRRYYQFGYKGCLFVVLDSNDGGDPKAAAGPYAKVGIGAEQRRFLADALKASPDIRWTFVCLHHPIWNQADQTETGWLEVEQLLAGRPHTVFCGHVHTFRKYLRNGTAYYQLATTGGGSALRGIEYGEFDQVAWVTMKGARPVIAHVGLDGVLPEDLQPIVTDEGGAVPGSAAGLAEVTGTVSIGGRPAELIQVTFTGLTGDAVPAANTRPAGTAKVLTEGRFAVYQNRGAAGLKPGRYAVTFAPAPGLIDDGRKRDNPVPERYRALNTTPLRVEVKADTRNVFAFDLVP